MDIPFLDTRPLYEYLSEQDTLPSGGVDAVFILGGGGIGPARVAAFLMISEVARHVAFTSVGGNFGGNLLWGCPEIKMYKSHLQKVGVDEEAILHPPLERGTTNTLMEAQTAIPFLRAHLGEEGVQKIVLCARSVHQRRASATFRKQWPDITFYNQPDREYLTIELLPRLVAEIDRLEEYGEKGDLVKQNIPADVRATCEELRRHLPSK